MRAANSARAFLFLQIILSSFAKTPTVRLSVPEGHYIILICPGREPTDSAPLEWRDGDGRVLATWQGHTAASAKAGRYSLLTDGSLFIRDLQPGDSGEFRCGDQVAADVQVLTGEEYAVSAGRTVLIPCKVTDKQKQKWTFRKGKRSERRTVFVRFRNGTLRKEAEDPRNRLSQTKDNALRISDLRPSDAGEYWCNGKKAAVLTVRTENPDYTNRTAFTTEETDTETDVPENDDSDHDSVSTAVLIGLGVLILLAGLLIFLVMNRKRNRKGDRRGIDQLDSMGPADGARHPVTMATEEPQNKTQGDPTIEAGDIHYASLGRQNWRERPYTQGERHHVIYSTVAGGPV
ncbi:CXADR-like membrane protein [Anguilla rostrata]|uniref:CXADR-like membrane protein n=1 Tax=Anguilla rostrata TaxID=7938 RepID=UPI0030D61CA2